MEVRQVIEDGRYSNIDNPIVIRSRGGNITQIIIGVLPAIEVRTLDLLAAIESTSELGASKGTSDSQC